MRLSECPVRPAIDVVDGKWKPIVVNALKAGRLRFGQLRRHASEASRKVLTEQLRELEGDQIISRRMLGEKWERVEYELTVNGEMGPKAQEAYAKKNGEESGVERRDEPPAYRDDVQWL